MIYTVGNTALYEHAFRQAEGGPPRKTGRHDDYPGGSVWETEQEAREHLQRNNLSGFSVYGVGAIWGVGTAPSAHGPWHDLLVDAPLIQLEGLPCSSGNTL